MRARGFIIKNSVRFIVGSSLVLLLAYSAYPSLAFPYSLQHDTISLHATTPIPEFIVKELALAVRLLKKSELYQQTPEAQYDVYIANHSPWAYRLLAADMGKGAFARTNIFNNVAIRQCDFSTRVCFSASNEFNQRRLFSLLAHEITHINIRQHMGYLNEYLLATWKKEGLADYVAKSSSYTFNNPYGDAQAVKGFIIGATVAHPSYDYYVYRLLASYMIDREQLTIKEFLGDDRTLVPIRNAARNAYQKAL